MAEIIIPSSPEDRKIIKEGIVEISNSKTRIEAENENIKAIKDRIKEKTGVAPTVIGKAADDYHKQKFDQKVKESEEYQEFYEIILK